MKLLIFRPTENPETCPDCGARAEEICEVGQYTIWCCLSPHPSEWWATDNDDPVEDE